MDASLLPARHARSKLLRVVLVIEPATTPVPVARAVAGSNLASGRNKKVQTKACTFLFGSGDWIRTSDLVVTLCPLLSQGCGLSHYHSGVSRCRYKALPPYSHE
jgi:hypothetical protein